MLGNRRMRFSCPNMEEGSNLKRKPFLDCKKCGITPYRLPFYIQLHMNQSDKSSQLAQKDRSCWTSSDKYLLILLAPWRFSCSHLNHSTSHTPYISRAKKNKIRVMKTKKCNVSKNHKSALRCLGCRDIDSSNPYIQEIVRIHP